MLKYKIKMDNKEVNFHPGCIDFMDSFNRFTEKEIQNMINEGNRIQGRYSAGIVGYRTCWAYVNIDACNIIIETESKLTV